MGLGPDRRILLYEPRGVLSAEPPGGAVGRDAAEVALSNDPLRRLVRGVNDTKKDADKGAAENLRRQQRESYFQVENTPLYITPSSAGANSSSSAT